MDILQPVLAQEGIHLLVEKKRILPMAFNQNPLDSNRIFIEGKPLETWLMRKPEKANAAMFAGITNAAP